VFERQSALGATLVSGCDDTTGRCHLQMCEVKGWQLVQLAAFPATIAELGAAVLTVVGSSLPERTGAAIAAGPWKLLKTSAEQFWILGPETQDLLTPLGTAVPAAIGTITPLSHSRVCVSIEGPAARSLLAQGIALDLHPSEFPVGGFALTAMHHTPVLLWRVGEDRYELYALRTFALSVWTWLADAALSYGVP
jgi:heterotetrameric sarcosine oxidase gamma subunit